MEQNEIVYRKATETDAPQITELVQSTIQAVYPRYYPKGVVAFFCQHHCKEHILADIRRGMVDVLFADGQLIGTGSHQGNHITRVFVAPQFQGNGYGKHILYQLEQQIAQTNPTVVLDASLPGVCIYEKQGYQTREHHRIETGSGDILIYETMAKDCAK